MASPTKTTQSCIQDHSLSILLAEALTEEKLNNLIQDTENMDIVRVALEAKLHLVKQGKHPTFKYNVERLLHRIYANPVENVLVAMSCALQMDNVAVIHIFKAVMNDVKLSVRTSIFDNPDELSNRLLVNVQVFKILLDVYFKSPRNTSCDFLCCEVGELITVIIESNIEPVINEVITRVIPQYLRIHNCRGLLPQLWFNLEGQLILKAACILREFFIPEIEQKENSDDDFLILKEKKFWYAIQNGLAGTEAEIQKVAFYMLDLSINYLYGSNINICIPYDEIAEVSLITWDNSDKDRMYSAFRAFITVCELSKEKQLRFVESCYELLGDLCVLHPWWQVYAIKKLLCHSHSAVVQFTVSYVLLSDFVHLLEFHDILLPLFQALNHSYLYEVQQRNSLPEISKHLSKFFERKYDTNKFFDILLEIPWAPVPFYFICSALKHLTASINSKEVEILLKTAAAIPSTYIRDGARCAIIDFLIVDRKNINAECIMLWICDICNMGEPVISYTTANLINWIRAKYCTGKLRINIHDPHLWDHKYARLYSLLSEARAIDLFSIYTEPPRSFTITFLSQLLTDLGDSIFQDISLSERVLYCIKDHISRFTFEDCKQLNKIRKIVQAIYEKQYDPCKDRVDFFTNSLVYDLKQEHSFTNGNDILIYLVKVNIFACLWNIETDESHTEACCEIFNTMKNFNLHLIPKQIIPLYHITYNDVIILSLKNSIINLTSLEYSDKGTDLLKGVVKIALNALDEDDDLMLPLETVWQDTYSSKLYLRSEFLRDVIYLTFHPNLINREDYMVPSYVKDLLTANPQATELAFFLMTHINKLGKEEPVMQFLDLTVECLLFDCSLRKDQRIEYDTCVIISNIYQHLGNNFSHNLNRQVRSHAVCVLIKILEEPSSHFAIESLLHTLFERYEEFSKKRYFVNSQVHFLFVHIMQVFLIMEPYMNEFSIIEKTIKFLLDVLLYNNHQQSVKVLVQWMLIRLLAKCPSLLIELEKMLLLQQKPSRIASGIGVLYHLVRHQDNKEFSEKVLTMVLPWTMGQNFNVRVYAQMTAKTCLDIIGDVNTSKGLYDSIVTVLNHTDSDKIQNDFFIKVFDPFLHYSAQTIFCDILCLTGVTYTEWFSTVDLREFHDNPVLNSPLRMEVDVSGDVDEFPDVQVSETFNRGSRPIQKKITPDDALFDDKRNKRTGALIVVASLLDRPPNLGGLSRTCEIFGVAEYVLNNLSYLKDIEFMTVSRSSHKWVNTSEVKVADLPQYLLRKKEEGYRVVGLEQTTASSSLGDYKFSEKTILLLGNEKSGIPPNLLFLVDDCVEIPQWGVVRSLNVHVAGALFIWEYTNQHLPKV